MSRFAAAVTLLGLSLSAAAAAAAEPITLSLGGLLREYFYVADQKSAPSERLSNTGMMNDVRLAFQGRAVMDNGLTIRAFARIYAVGRFNRTLDEAYAEVHSVVGRFRAGETEGVNARILGEPVPEALLTRDEEILGRVLKPRTGITVADAFNFRRFTGNSLGVSYESPEIASVKLGVAYHPELSRTGGGAPFDKRLVANNALDVSAAFSGDYSGGTYRVGVGYFHSNPGLAVFAVGHTAVNVTAGITYGGWDLSGSYIDISPSTGLDEQAWTVGAMYSIGPFRVSANYMQADREATRNGSRRESLDRETLQGSYKLAPGVTVGIAGFRADQTDANGLSWDGTGFLSGIKLVF